jgi:uncharacterized OB-fold protein
MHYETRYCTHCATPLQWVIQAEDGGDVSRLRCPECGWTHWNNPTPVLAAIVELDGKVLLYRLLEPEKVQAWPSGTGMALAKWLRSRGHDPEIRDFWKRAEQAQDAEASRADQDTAAGLRRDAA